MRAGTYVGRAVVMALRNDLFQAWRDDELQTDGAQGRRSQLQTYTPLQTPNGAYV